MWEHLKKYKEKDAMSRMLLCLTTLLAVGSPAALADWNPGDPYKMHYPQLPDPTGIDVNFRSPVVLADDWQCTETGAVSDVHFWFSAQQDASVLIYNVHLSIHENIPAGGGVDYSRPGALLWERDFAPTQVTWRPYGQGPQGWLDPSVTPPYYNPIDHTQYYQMNVTNILDPFYQYYGSVYWLDVSISSLNPLGWKTSSSPQFMDTAVWSMQGSPNWLPVYDPRSPTQTKMDLAFVITPEPGSALLMLVGVVGLLRRRSR
jgi:hypothetical protein